MKHLTPIIPPTLAVAEGATSPNPGQAGAVLWSSTTSTMMTWDGSKWVSLQKSVNMQTVLLGSDLTSTSTSLADATGLSFSVKSGVRYRFKFWIAFQSAATTTGLVVSVNAPALNTDGLAYNCTIPISATADVLGYRRAVDTNSTGTGVDSTGASLLSIVEGYVYPSADGTLILRFATEVGSSTITVKAGSHGELTALATTSPAAFENTPIGIDDVTGTTYTTVQGDQGRLKRCTNAAAVTATIPPNSSVPYPIGTIISFVQDGTGQVTLAAGAGVTLNNALTLKTRARYSVISATKYGTDTWYVAGDMATS